MSARHLRDTRKAQCHSVGQILWCVSTVSVVRMFSIISSSFYGKHLNTTLKDIHGFILPAKMGGFLQSNQK